MRGETVARNYAEALFEVASREGDLEGYGRGMETVARLLDEQPDFRVFLETPRVALEEKKALVRRVFGPTVPKRLLNFVLLVLDKRRQRLLQEIARSYHALVDERLNRVHVEVTVARPLAADALQTLGHSLSQLLGRTAVPNVRVRPEILGGVVVRAGDRLYDGSLKRRLADMRRQLLTAGLSAPH